MRAQFVKTVSDLLKSDGRVVLLLGDIGVHGFSEAIKAFPGRVLNIGVLEQSMVGVAAGLAMAGHIPIVHTIAPFLVERALEQIKIDFGYQDLGGVFVTVGASYDYAGLGCTHHCPADVELVRSIPCAKVFVPGHSEEFDYFLYANYAGKSVNYFRLSERQNVKPVLGHSVLKWGSCATIVAVGPVLEEIQEASEGFDVNILYTSAVSLFEKETKLAELPGSDRILLVEPYYEGGLTNDILKVMWPRPVLLRTVGVPRRFLTNYGARGEHDEAIGLTAENIRRELESLIDA